MKTKHVFVPALDVGEVLPFEIRPTKTLAESLVEQERARGELTKFIDVLQKHFGEEIWYMGMDVIGEKSYERFMFESDGFFEVMVEPPVAMNAHFVHDARAKKFEKAIKKAIKSILPEGPMADMFMESIEVQDESDPELKVKSWNKMKEVRSLGDE